MVEIGYRPLMWHLMRYYAHFGHNEFILCLGNRGDYIKKYFLNYDECLSNDFVMTRGGKDVELSTKTSRIGRSPSSIPGLNTNIGQRLLAVKDLLHGEDVFMANYADGLTDLDLDAYLAHFRQHDRVASFLSVKPSQSFHVVSARADGLVEQIQPVDHSEVWINGGFFVFKQSIFDYIREGEELVQEPFYRLIAEGQLVTYRNPRLLGLHRHAQGKEDVRRHVCQRRHALDGVGAHLEEREPWQLAQPPLPRRAWRRPILTEGSCSSSFFPIPKTRRCSCSAWARTPTTSRSAAAGRFFAWRANTPGWRCIGW